MARGSPVGGDNRYPFMLQLAHEVFAMASHASGSGLAVPAGVVDIVARLDAVQDEGGAEGLLAYLSADANRAALAQAHDRMRLLVAPSTPRTLLLIAEEAARPRRLPFLPSLGPVQAVRHLTVVALLLMAAFIGLALSGDVNRQVGGILDESGISLLLNLLFVLSAAGLGAVFAALFQASRHVRDGTYDPTNDSTYWLNIVLGLIAGLLLAELLPEVLGTEPDSGFSLQRPILALVGGFSAAVVFRILRRLVDATESIFSGDIGERVQAAVAATQARLATQQAEDRLRLSATLMQIEQQLNAGAPPDAVASRVRAVLDEMLPFAASGPSPNGDAAPVSQPAVPAASEPAPSEPAPSEPASEPAAPASAPAPPDAPAPA